MVLLYQQARTGPYWLGGTALLLVGQDETLVAERKRIEQDRQEMDRMEGGLAGVSGGGPTIGMRRGPIGGKRWESRSLNVACGIKIKINV